MPLIRKSVLVPYSVERMFSLVADVTAYPQFMPWCGGARSTLEPDGRTRATLDIDYRGVRTSFTTLNVITPPESLVMHLVDGPFTRLEGEWRLAPLAEDAAKVEFQLEYQFASTVLGKLVAPVFDGIARSFIDAFTRRAESLYG